MRKLLLAAITAVLIAAPVASRAHESVAVEVCGKQVSASATNDCVRVDTDTEFEEGAEVNLDGDDANPRGDDISDGYIHATVTREGEVTVYCEDEGDYNYPESRPGGDKDDANGTNEECEPV